MIAFCSRTTNSPVKGRKVHIPKLRWVRLHEVVRFVGNGLSGTNSRTADHWFLRIPVEILDPPIVSRTTQWWSAWIWGSRRSRRCPLERKSWDRKPMELP